MNVYDFDRTIFPGDSSIHFWKYCMKQYPSVRRVIPRASWAVIKYVFKLMNWGEVTEVFFTFMKHLPSPKDTIEAFWDDNLNQISPWYLAQKQDSDVVISASPAFLIEPICRRLGVHCIATRMDIETKKIDGLECSGEEKKRRFHECYGDEPIEEFYSDSHLDTPLAKYARKAFMVDEGTVKPWQFKK